MHLIICQKGWNFWIFFSDSMMFWKKNSKFKKFKNSQISLHGSSRSQKYIRIFRNFRINWENCLYWVLACNQKCEGFCFFFILSYLFYNQIWLHLLGDDHWQFGYIFLTMIANLATSQNRKKKPQVYMNESKH